MSAEKLIELVRAQQCMYDKRDAKYKDVKLKEKIWEEISRELKIEVKECKVKWKSLRDRYRKEKMANDCPSGSATKHGAPWKYFDCLHFLADSLESASTSGNVRDGDGEEEWLCEEESLPSVSQSRTPNLKRRNDDVIAEVLEAMKKKYEAPVQSTEHDKYDNFFGMLRQKLDKLPEEDVDEVEVEILRLVNQRIYSKK